MTYIDAMVTRASDPRAARTISALMQAAEQLFGKRSLDDVTVEEIAEAAGVAVGSIYNHFGSKAGLYAAIVQNAVDVDREHMDRAYVEGRSPREQLEAAAEEYLAFYLAQPEYFKMLAFPGAAGSYAAGTQVADELADAVEIQNARMVAAITAGIAAGAMRPVDPQQTATVLWASWNGIISLGWRPDRLGCDVDQLRALLTSAVDVITSGLIVDPA